MRTFKLKIPESNIYNVAGFTLVELLMAISIMGITASLISVAVSSMISSNQNLVKEQNRRVEASRAIDLIANDVKVSQIVTATKPAGASSTAVAVLSMDLVTGACSDTTKNRITYLIKPVTAGSTTEIGPNVLYRHGVLSDVSNGAPACSDSLPTGDGYPIADAIDRGTLDAPTCSSSAVLTGNTGFYSCVNNVASPQLDAQQVSVALFSKLSGNKTYGINRTITSGFSPNTPTSTNDCNVPDITSTTKTPTQANTAITAAGTTLLYNGIDIEAGGTTVITQNPLAGTKLPCNKGLVTYTY
jgi:prepilin-type N-terminal cleavage/methylation domain-containing protein